MVDDKTVNNCAYAITCDTKYDCTTGQICAADYACGFAYKHPQRGDAANIPGGVCQGPPPCKSNKDCGEWTYDDSGNIAQNCDENEENCTNIAGPGDYYIDDYPNGKQPTLKCHKGQCIQTGYKQRATIQLMWIVFIGLAYITLGKITQHISHGKSPLLPVILFGPIFIMYTVMMLINYIPWTKFNANMTFTNNGLPPYIQLPSSSS